MTLARKVKRHPARPCDVVVVAKKVIAARWAWMLDPRRPGARVILWGRALTLCGILCGYFDKQPCLLGIRRSPPSLFRGTIVARSGYGFLSKGPGDGRPRHLCDDLGSLGLVSLTGHANPVG